VKSMSFFRTSRKLEKLSVSELLSFSAQPLKVSILQLPPELSKQASEMFQLIMKCAHLHFSCYNMMIANSIRPSSLNYPLSRFRRYMGDYPARLSQKKYDSLPFKVIQMAIDNKELRDEYGHPFSLSPLETVPAKPVSVLLAGSTLS